VFALESERVLDVLLVKPRAVAELHRKRVALEHLGAGLEMPARGVRVHYPTRAAGEEDRVV
jgi:hypothetical protein